jgi:hypothetical protein
LNDECLACGIILSKFQRAEKNAPSPVSFVAPTLPSTAGAPSAVTDNQYKVALEKSKTYIQISLIVLLVTLVGGGFLLFQHFRKSTSAYGGLYRNDRQIFAIRFPNRGWNHYYSNEFSTLPLKNPKDAFYFGNDRDDPDIFLGMWVEIMPQQVPSTISDERRQDLFDTASDEITAKMEAAGLDCTITQSEFRGNGAIMDAEVLRGQERLVAKIRTAYWLNRSYTLIILGKEESMASEEEEILRILNSLSFNMSIV